MIQSLIKQLRTMKLKCGKNETAIPYLHIYQSISPNIIMPDSAAPYIWLIADGSMRLHTPSGIMDYLPGQYSVSAIDTPIAGQVLTRSEYQDFIAVSVSFTLDDAISVILDIEGNLTERIMQSDLDVEVMADFDKKVTESVLHLIKMQNHPEQIAFSAKMVRKEMIFDVLCGTCGRQFIQSITGIQQAGEIYKINTWIKENYKENFSVKELAKLGNMSVSNFHQKFKSAVGMGPLQCQKRLRLTEARRQMLDENASVTEAATNVGYDSISQFNRDYKKMFMTTPTEDIQILKKHMQK